MNRSSPVVSVTGFLVWGALALALMVAAVGCSSDAITGPGALSSIVVTPNVMLATKATQQFSAVGKDAAGLAVPIVPTWTVTGGGGSISSTGLFTANTTSGTYTSTVQARSGAVAGVASVVVIDGAVASVVVP